MVNEEIDNISLIRDNLDHIRLELTKNVPSLFRVAKESYHTLYRSMIEALRGTANLQITYDRKRKKRNHTHQYKLGNAPWVEIKKINITGCKFAWRFSEPVQCDPPEINVRSNWGDIIEKEFLIGFYEALAMIQSECFMSKYIMSKVVPVTDSEMKELEWLYIRIRNTFEHFIPMTWFIGKPKLIDVSLLCLKLSKELLFESRNIIFHEPMTDISEMITGLSNKINQIKKEIEA